MWGAMSPSWEDCVPILGGPDTSSLLASASHPWVQPAHRSLGSSRRVSSGGCKRSCRGPRASEESRFPPGREDVEQEEEPPRDRGAAGPAEMPSGGSGGSGGRGAAGASNPAAATRARAPTSALSSHVSLYVCAVSNDDLSPFPDLGCLACCSGGCSAGPSCLSAWTQEGDVKFGA